MLGFCDSLLFHRMRKRYIATGIARTNPKLISNSKYQMGSFAPQHFAVPLVASQPITGMFSYQVNCRPQAQWLLPVMGSFLGTRSSTTPRKDAMDAPRKNARKVSMISNITRVGTGELSAILFFGLYFRATCSRYTNLKGYALWGFTKFKNPRSEAIFHPCFLLKIIDNPLQTQYTGTTTNKHTLYERRKYYDYCCENSCCY